MSRRIKIGDVIRKKSFDGYVCVVAKIIKPPRPEPFFFPLIEYRPTFLVTINSTGATGCECKTDYIWLNEDYSLNESKTWEKVDI